MAKETKKEDIIEDNVNITEEKQTKKIVKITLTCDLFYEDKKYFKWDELELPASELSKFAESFYEKTSK